MKYQQLARKCNFNFLLLFLRVLLFLCFCIFYLIAGAGEFFYFCTFCAFYTLTFFASICISVFFKFLYFSVLYFCCFTLICFFVLKAGAREFFFTFILFTSFGFFFLDFYHFLRFLNFCTFCIFCTFCTFCTFVLCHLVGQSI